MDHQEQHHQQHRKEREHEKHERKLHEHQQENEPRSIHSLWFMATGVVLVGAVIGIWI